MSEDPLPLSHFLRKFWSFPLEFKLSFVFGTLRYLLRFHQFDSRELIVLGRGVKIRKQKHARLVVGRGARIREGCEFHIGDGRPGDMLSIGTRTSIGPKTRIWAAKRVQIGARCLVSRECEFVDTIGHHIYLENGHQDPEAPIIVEDDVWIGARVMILKGVTVGRNSIIGAGSVVRRDIPPNSIAYGNPTRRAGALVKWSREAPDEFLKRRNG